MCTFIASTGFYLKRNKVSALPKLPGTINGYPAGVVRRLSIEGVITPDGIRKKERVWAQGKNWNRMTEWWERHE